MAMTAAQFNWVVFSGKRANPGEHVAKLQHFLGASQYELLRWHVGRGDREAYMKGGACNVFEMGTASDAVNGAIDLCNRSRKPTVVMADDLESLRQATGDLRAWYDSRGCIVPVLTAVNSMHQAAKSINASVVGLYPKVELRQLLASPTQTVGAFLVGDFFLLLPPIVSRWEHVAWPKEDYHFSAQLLKDGHLTCRLNRIGIKCCHHQSDGDGNGAKRLKADKKACVFLLKQHPKIFKCQSARAGQVTMSHALKLLPSVDVQEAAKSLQTALRDTAMKPQEVKDLLSQASAEKQNNQAAAKHSKRDTRLGDRQRRRKSRGTMATGAKRKAGRRRSNAKPLANNILINISKRRGDLKNAIAAQRRKRRRGC